MAGWKMIPGGPEAADVRRKLVELGAEVDLESLAVAEKAERSHAQIDGKRRRNAKRAARRKKQNPPG